MNAKQSGLPRWFISLYILTLLLASGVAAHATSDIWLSDADGSWSNAVSWAGGNVPGATNVLTSTDEALFGALITTNRIVYVDTNRNIGTITFSNAYTTPGSVQVNGYNLTNGSIKLTAGGVIQTALGANTNFDRIYSPVEIQGDATFRNNTVGNGSGLLINTVTGTASTGNTNILYLDGVSTSSGVGGVTRNNTIGALGNGANGGKVKLVKNGTGLWTLSANSTFGGGFDVNAVTVRFFGNGSQFGTGAITIADGVTFSHANAGAITMTQPVIVNGNFTHIGTAGGPVWGGTMDLGASTRTITVTADIGISGVISGSGGLTKAGTGYLTNYTANTYGGDTTISAGTLVLGAANAIPSGASKGNVTVTGTLDVNGFSPTINGLNGAGTITNSIAGTQTLTVGGNDASGLFTGIIKTGTGGLNVTKTGAGTQTLSGANTFTGVLTLNQGVLSASQSASTLTVLGSGTLALNGGELQLASSAGRNYGRNTTVGGNVTMTSDSTAVGGNGFTYTFGTLGIGAQTLTVQAAANPNAGTAGITFGATTLTGASTFTVNTNGLGAATLLTLGTVDNGGFTPIFNGTGDATPGIMSGAGGFTKSGSGTLTLSAAHLFTGNVTVNGGLVKVTTGTATSTLGSDPSTLTLNGGELRLASNAGRTYGRNTTVGGNATITVDRSAVGAGISYTMGTLGIGSQELTINTSTNVTAGAGTITFGATTITGNAVFTVNTNNAGALTRFTIGALAGTGGSLTKNGISHLTLTATATTFDGNSTLNAGLIRFGADNALGTAGSLTLNGGGISSDSATARSIANNTILGGDVTLGTAAETGALTLAGNMNLGGTTRQIDLDNAMTIAGIVSNGGLTKSGTGTLTLSGANSYSGSTTIAAGAISVASINSNLGGTGAINLGSGATAGTLIFTKTNAETVTRAINLAGTTGGGVIQNNSISNAILTVSGDIGSTGAGSKTLTLNGSSTGLNVLSGVISDAGGANTTSLLLTDGAWTLNGTNTFSGGVTVNSAGSVRAANDRGYGTGTLTMAGGSWNSSGSHTITNSVVISANSTGNSLSAVTDFTGSISGTGNWSVNGFASGTMKFSGNNSGWSGSFKITGANLVQLNNVNALGTGANFTFSDGLAMGVLESLVDISGGSGLTQNILLGVTGAGGTTSHPEIKTTADLKVSGVVSGPTTIGLNKTGAGKLTLNNLNTYIGTTTVSNGTLVLNATNFTTLVTVKSNATLGGNGYLRSVAVEGGATLAPGASVGRLSLTNLTLAATATNLFEFDVTGNTNDIVDVLDLTAGGSKIAVSVANGTLGSGTYRLFNYGTKIGSFDSGVVLAGGVAGHLTVDDSTANQVNLFVTNNAPVAGAANYTRTSGESIKIALTNLLTHATDLDGDAITFVGVSATTNGAALLTDADWIYVPTNTVADAFTYTVRDNFGGTNSGTVTVSLATAYGQETGALTVTGPTVTAQFAGVVGLSYIVQRGTNAGFGGVVRNFPATNAPAGGLFTVTDDFDDILTGTNVPTEAYYRLQYNPAP
ncbi:MAG: autotransporter-associated beta strand repeat-containing protein [Verrucomicrobia bacterium]|nr:autotransporter-associated beta strand repeat-containing protein [Verrucomicrobiota bacterium]